MYANRLSRRGRTGIGLALACAFALVVAPAAFGATFTVSNTHDSGAGSLREAIEKANDETTNPGKDTIKITATGSIGLESELPSLASDMAIVGPGASSLTVTRAFGAPDFRIFTVESATDSISRLSVKKGSARGLQAYGGGIYNAGGILTLKSAVIAKNSAVNTDSGGSAFGGGILSSGTLTVKTSRITDNQVGGTSGSVFDGGGIESQGTLHLARSTVDGNNGPDATVSYGGLIENSTIAENDAIGLATVTATTTTLRSSTIAGNAGDGTFPVNVNVAGTTSFQNTIVADHPNPGNDCHYSGTPTVISQGHNLESEISCGFEATGDRQNKDPKLGPLTNNGGPTPTRAIPMSSPATDRGDSDGLKTDQRGKKRPVDFPSIQNGPGGDGADIGAFEIQ